MSPSTISFRLVPDVQHTSGRAVGVLEGDPDLCADVLLNLPKKDWKYIQYSMDRWTSGLNGPSTRFHPFEGTDYFVFKHVAQQHRFYGFLYHPVATNKRFLLCVLTTYAQKKEDATDPADLKRVQAWMDAPATPKAIKFFYPDEGGDKDKKR
jgi:hypothetical protein